MHEMSIAQNIFDIVREEMARHQVQKLQAVNIVVGELSAVVPSSLTFCWNILVEDTDLAETELKIRVAPLTYRCYDCGQEFTAEDLTFECPHCGGREPTLTAGRELTIESLEVAA